MTRFLATAAKISATAALLMVGSSCTNPPVTYAGPWPGWKNIDEGGFEEKGTVTWHDAALYHGDAKAVGVGYGSAHVTAEYEFYIAREGLARFCPHRTYVPLFVKGNTTNRIVLDQAAISGSLVHVSGRQHSGLGPGGAYVEVIRVTDIKRQKRIAW